MRRGQSGRTARMLGVQARSAGLDAILATTRRFTGFSMGLMLTRKVYCFHVFECLDRRQLRQGIPIGTLFTLGEGNEGDDEK